MLAGRPVPMFGDGTSARDYTFIDDIVDGIVGSLDAADGFDIFNLGGSRTTTLRALIDLIAAAAGVEPTIDRLPDQPGDVPITYADVAKAKRLWGWEPAVPIEEGIRRFVAWFREHRLR
jgi:UDP-glucuronate 4-epimerase